jgi:hypothetical protein
MLSGDGDVEASVREMLDRLPIVGLLGEVSPKTPSKVAACLRGHLSLHPVD